MDLGLKGRKAAITGGTRGIGRAIAELLADEGCDIAICARGGDSIGSTVEALEAKGVNATGGAADVRDGLAMTDWAAAAAADTLGGIDILIANASGFGLTLDDAGWREGFEVDIMGTFHAVEVVMPALEKSDAGAIVAISIIAAVESFGSVRPYNAVKAAVIAYVSNLAGALASRNIRANCVSPGTIYFEGGVWHQRELDALEIYQGALAKNPMGRMGSAEEVANAVVFLASPAASFVTGTNMIVDGAFTNRVQF